MGKQAFSSSVTRVLAIGAAAVAAVAGSAMHAPVAHACGGFFCSQAKPVDQTAEEIVFIDNPDDTVTAIIRINYQGPSEHFAWVLPIEGAPTKVEVSSNTAFDNLRNSTDPQYQLTTTVEGTCKQQQFPGGGVAFANSAPTSKAADAGASSGVTVVDQGSVGPYDWEVIMVDPMLSDAADVAVKWLTAHGYDVTDLGPTVLRPYLKEGLNLMAFKLTKGAGADTGSIRPVIITYNSKLPMIPIRPTAVAAQPDMGILVWLLSDKQAVPQNYKSLVLNEALINWLPNGQYFGGPVGISPGGSFPSYSSSPQNYRAVVTAAANEAGGQGFVTEMAGDSKKLDKIVFPDYAQQQWMQFSLTTFMDGFDMISQASGQYRGWDGWKEAVCGAVTLPAGLDCTTFGRNPNQYRSMVQIDQTKFLKMLYEGVVKPVISTQQLLLSRPYFTRMFTTMSPDEMNLDPVFDFNPDLADVSNIHMAKQVIECNPNITQDQAPWRIELPQGGVINGKGSGAWPIAIDSGVPANLKIVQLSTSGSGKVNMDNSNMILKMLGMSPSKSSGTAGSGASAQVPANQRVPIGGGSTAGGGTGSTPTNMTGAPGSAKSGGGCAVHDAGASDANRDLAGLLVLGLAVGAVRRRRALPR